MGLFYQLATIDRNNLHALADFLIRGPWAIKQLEMLAEAQVVSLRRQREDFEEEVQVYLAYPILLREQLALFLDVDVMLYGSDVTEEDLQVAESYVNGLLAGRDARIEILSKDEIWRSSLSVKYPQEYAALVAAKEEALAASEDPDYFAIEERFVRDIQELTRLSLQGEEGSFDAALEEWARGIPEENRQRAVNKIRYFLTNPDASSLDLSNLGVPMPLPFFHPEVQEIFASRLRILNLEGNSLEYLPDMHRLQALKELSLENNKFREFPLEICQLQNLIVLNLKNNHLQALPAEIGQLRALEWLHLGHNELNALPPEFGQLRALEWVSLDGNELNELPPEIGQLYALESLNVDNNYLEALPPEIGQLGSLEELFLTYNWLETLPPEIGQLCALKKLDVENNRLQVLPGEIGQLEALEQFSAGHNRLQALPGAIGQLEVLTSLFLGNNELRSLPPTISELQMLLELDLSGNLLTTLPPEFSQLFLINLHLKNNPLDELLFPSFNLTPRGGEDAGQIDLQNTYIPLPLQNQLREAYSSPDYAGPLILLP